MANLYYQVFDRSRKAADPNFSIFGHCHINNDLAGLVTAMARRNGSPVDDIRLFIYESKKAWDIAFESWRNQIIWA